jgi:hypothetical protein
MNNDITMVNKEHETFKSIKFNNNIKNSKTLIYLLIL